MTGPKLFMLLLGCKPAGRNTEQHDILFAIGDSLKDLIPQIEKFWPDAGKIHIDGWREVTMVDGFTIRIFSHPSTGNSHKLFFLNLGGYKQHEFEEFHYKMLVVSTDKGEAVMRAKQTAFYKHTGFEGADSHIDDKYGIDIDDVYEIQDVLDQGLKERFHIHMEKAIDTVEDELHLGYFKLSTL